MARILIIDDNPSYLELMKGILLKYAGYDYNSRWELAIHTTANANSALELVKNNNYELEVVDILMAKINEFEFIKEVRKKFPQFKVPVIVVSAVDAIELEYQTLRHGASAWFQKPLSPKKFAHDVFSLLEGS